MRKTDSKGSPASPMFRASCDSGGILHRSCSLLMLFPGTFWTPLPLPELGGYRPDFSQPTPLYSLFWKLSPTSKQMAVLELCVCNPSHPPLQLFLCLQSCNSTDPSTPSSESLNDLFSISWVLQMCFISREDTWDETNPSHQPNEDPW